MERKKNNNILHILLRLISISIFNALVFVCVFFFIYAVWSARSFAIHLSCRCFFLRWFRLNSVLDQCVRKPFVEWKCIWTCLTHSPKSENARRLCILFVFVLCYAMLYVFFSLYVRFGATCVQYAMQNDSLRARFAYCAL